LTIEEVRRAVEVKRSVWMIPEDEEFQIAIEREIKSEALHPYARDAIVGVASTVGIPVPPDMLDPTVPIIVFDNPTDAVYLYGKVAFISAFPAIAFLLKKHGKVIVCNSSGRTYVVRKEDVIAELERRVKRTRRAFDKEYYGKGLEYLAS
jgi:hypothetical protein